MKTCFVAVILVLCIASLSCADDVSSGYCFSIEELTQKIDELRDMILYNYQRSGLTLWAPLYYWRCSQDQEKIFYRYTFLPLGTNENQFARRVVNEAGNCRVEPVYVPIKLNRAGSMRS